MCAMFAVETGKVAAIAWVFPTGPLHMMFAVFARVTV